MKINLTYFKESGKYYSEGTYTTQNTYLWDIVQEIKAMSPHPGLVWKWTEGPILVESDEIPPALIRVRKNFYSYEELKEVFNKILDTMER